MQIRMILWSKDQNLHAGQARANAVIIAICAIFRKKYPFFWIFWVFSHPIHLPPAAFYNIPRAHHS